MSGQQPSRTPGAWIAERILGTKSHEATWAVSGLTDAGNDTRTIALVGGDHAEGDARLLATAPKLLALLEDALDSFAAHVEGGEANEWVKFSRAAVAEATGSTR